MNNDKKNKDYDLIIEWFNTNQKQVQGTGPDGQIRAQDVSNFVVSAPAAVSKQAAAAGAGKQDFEDLALNNFRAVTAKRLTLSKQTIPHYYLTIDFEIDNALKYEIIHN